MQPITISAEQETASSVSGSSSRVSSARSLVSSMWAGSEEPDYDTWPWAGGTCPSGGGDDVSGNAVVGPKERPRQR